MVIYILKTAEDEYSLDNVENSVCILFGITTDLDYTERFKLNVRDFQQATNLKWLSLDSYQPLLT